MSVRQHPPSIARRLSALVALALVVTVWSTACRTLPAQPPSDLDRLQGHWQGRGPGGPCTVTISGHSLHYAQPTESSQPDFWWDTRFTMPEAPGPPQLHAKILDNSPDRAHIGTVVATIYKIDGDSLTLGVIRSYTEPPSEPLVGDWDYAMDIYELTRVVGQTDAP